MVVIDTESLPAPSSRIVAPNGPELQHPTAAALSPQVYFLGTLLLSALLR